jgi:hypothetical protein
VNQRGVPVLIANLKSLFRPPLVAQYGKPHAQQHYSTIPNHNFAQSRQCRIFFNKSKKQLPRPLRPLNSDQVLPKRADYTSKSAPSCKVVDSKTLWKQTVLDQSKFKNLMIYTSELPATPAWSTSLRLSHYYRVKVGVEQKRKTAVVHFGESRKCHTESNVVKILGCPVTRSKTSKERTITSSAKQDEEVSVHCSLSREPPNQPGSEEGNRGARIISNSSRIRKSPLNALASVAEDEPLYNFSQYRTPSILSAPSIVFDNSNIFPIRQGPPSLMSEPPINFDHDPFTTCYDGYTPSHGVDLTEYICDRFFCLLDPLPLDRSLAVQARTYVLLLRPPRHLLNPKLMTLYSSGLLNAKCYELRSLQALVQRRLKSAICKFSHGMEDIRETRSNLEWVQARIRYA